MFEKKEKLKAEFSRESSPHIDVVLADGTKITLWHNFIAHGAELLSLNEQKEVVKILECEMNNMEPENYPEVFQKMVDDLKSGKDRTKEEE